jgi:hypothetical protein
MYKFHKANGSSSLLLEGTAVLGRNGVKLGSIESAIMDRASGALSHVVMRMGLFGFVAARYVLPWHRLDYDDRRAAYRVNLTRQQLQAASLPENPFGMGL